jgi:S1-C subfamily serine protease
VNLLDALLALAMVAAAYSGYRFGLAARALSWAGLAIGLLIGVTFVNDVARSLHGSTPRTRLLASLAFLLLVAVAGQSLGIALGSVVRRHLPAIGVIRIADRVAGAMAGVFGVLVVVWLLIPGLANAPGWTARAVRGSAIVRQIDRMAGSVVKVQGQACDVIQQGSGVVVASGIIVTNAHVVAGERATTVLVPGGGPVGVTVVAFDPVRDLAVLRTARLGVAPLPIADAQVDETGGVFGYPGGGNEQQAPARVAQIIVAQGSDIYHSRPTQRDVLVLATHLVPGNSGGPLVDDRGRVAGIAFAVDPGAPSTAYALATDEVNAVLRPVLAAGGGAAVGTGPCLQG